MLTQVKATHEYQSRDSDELSFKKGDIIEVMPFDDPDDQVCVLIIFFYNWPC